MCLVLFVFCVYFILDVLFFHYVHVIYYIAYLCWAFVQCMCFECEYECGVNVCGLRDSILVLVLMV